MTEKIRLSNGGRVLLEPIPHLRSVSIGFWVAAGSRLEKQNEQGICHFIEHMLFKGTRRRSAQQIAMEIDGVGGILNGFTSREYSSFYIKVIDQHLPLAIDLLADLYLHSTFDPLELERERGVILQEIKMVDDTPEDLVMDLFHKVFWRQSPMGHPVQGDSVTIAQLPRELLLDRLGRHYQHRDTLFSIAGHFEPEVLVRLLEERVGDMKSLPRWPPRRPPESFPGLHVVNKDLEQVHVCLGFSAPTATQPERFQYFLLNTILGGGMSSRLFQEVREKRGLAYAAYSFLSIYADAGLLSIYLGTTRDMLCEALTVILEQIDGLAAGPPSMQELDIAREQIKGGLILGLESSDRRMGRQAKNELYFGRDVPVDEVLEQLEAVTAEDVQAAAGAALRLDAMGGVLLGPVALNALPGPLQRIAS
jgi:predicted Zn-dependent peptidase